jgi:ATP-dependent DNA helicase RecQ
LSNPANDAEKQALLLHLLEEGKFRMRHTGKCIIYCATRKKVEQIFELLKSHGFNAGRYHAGRSNAGREKMHDSYAAGKVNILVATNAFGMGMDAPDVRMVLHYQVPSSIDAYYQESGRAGRDGRPSDCVLFFNNSDFVTQSFILGNEGNGSDGLLAFVREFGFSQQCRQKFLCAYFGEEIASCGKCDFCLAGEENAAGSFLKREQEKKQALAERSAYPFKAQEIEALHTVLREFPGKFGKKILAGILRGSKARDIIRYRLSQSSVYGALSHVPEDSIVRFFEDGIKAGQIKIAGTKYPRIYLAENPPLQRKPAVSASHNARKQSSRSPESELLRQLVNFRDREARRLKWKKYMVMQNAILARIAALKPESQADLSLVKGLGQARVEKFGREILRIVQASHTR